MDFTKYNYLSINSFSQNSHEHLRVLPHYFVRPPKRELASRKKFRDHNRSLVLAFQTYTLSEVLSGIGARPDEATLKPRTIVVGMVQRSAGPARAWYQPKILQVCFIINITLVLSDQEHNSQALVISCLHAI